MLSTETGELKLSWFIDIRKQEKVFGRSINLALSCRGREALKAMGLEEDVIRNGIPMYGRMIHDIHGNTKPIYYGRKDQVSLSSSFLRANIHTDRPVLLAVPLPVSSFVCVLCGSVSVSKSVYEWTMHYNGNDGHEVKRHKATLTSISSAGL